MRNAGHEAFAQALARGATPREASEKVGYAAHARQAPRVAARADVIKRTAQIRQELAWGGSGDLKPVIDEMMRLAKEAGKLKTAAGMIAAKGFLVEAARLKGLLPAAQEEFEPHEPTLSEEAWLARFAPPRD